MGTSTMGSDLHSDKQDKLLKLQARKKELEQMLASKNEELYKLCVQEVQLTGVVPPEAPLSPDAPPRERAGSVRSADRPAAGADVQDGADPSRPRADAGSRKPLCHRLSTPSISGVARHPRRPDTSCSNFFPSPPQERHPDTFSVRTSHTYPALAGRLEPPPPPHALPEHSNKMYYHPGEAYGAARLRETHFSSSHPDITAPAPHAPARTPLLYQYASHLKSQSQHLAALSHHHQMQAHCKRRAEGARRSTLQRTQTYHLTSHSDYSQHLDAMAPRGYRPEQPAARAERSVPVPSTLPLRERAPRPPPHVQLATDDRSRSDSVSIGQFSPPSPMDARAKEKRWYETSLDSPALRQSGSKRPPGAADSQPYEIMMSSGRYSAARSPGGAPALSPGAVALESPKNMTVIEQGKCIPYREETKPFEMSDFYKYSTKFRQANAPKPAAPPPARSPPAELPQPSPDQWHGYAN